MNPVAIGLRIKKCRKLLKMTQEELAEQIDVSTHYIYELEKGLKTMSLSVLAEISITLNVSTDYLIFGNEKNLNSDSSQQYHDKLSLIIQNLSFKKREQLVNILEVLLPELK